MWRALFIFAIFAGLSGLAVWLADNPGDLVVHWQGYELRSGFVVGFGVMAGLAFLVSALVRLAMRLLASPAGFHSFLDTRRRRKGYLALSRGMVAVAAGDAGEARRYAGQAHRLLNEPPLTLLLAAQAAQLEGDEQAARGYFEAMLEAPETAVLGLRGLFVQARRAGDGVAALGFARRAFALQRKTRWAAQAVFELEAAEGDWRGALKTLDSAVTAKLVSREDARRRRAVLLTAEGMALEKAARAQAGEARTKLFEQALALGLKAAHSRPGFVPAVALAGRMCGELNRVRKGAKLIEEAWAHSPHPDLAVAYARLTRDEAAYDRLARLRGLASKNPDHVESDVMLARAAIGARNWDAARDSLRPHLEARASARICELMADIEEGQYGHHGRAREWLQRALHAPADAQWVCDGYRSDDWSPICPLTGAFDALEWRVPDAVLAPPPAAPAEKTASPLEVAPSSAPSSAPLAAHDRPVRAAADDALRAETSGGDDAPEPAVILPAAPIVAPDDPGTDDYDGEGLDQEKEEARARGAKR